MLATACALLLLLGEPGRGRRIAGGAVVLTLAAALLSSAAPPLVAVLVIAALALEAEDPLHSECAVKLLWVFGAALALSWCGNLLLSAATGTDRASEQWGVLSLGLEARLLWSASLGLSLFLGLVLLGGAPFHFWVGDLMQGARPWLGPLSLVALQGAGAAWLGTRLDGMHLFTGGAHAAQEVLRIASVAGLVVGALTLPVQRRPERRVGTLASLQGALVVSAFAAGQAPSPIWLAAWSAHATLTLTGASTLARFLPALPSVSGPPGSLARRYPFAVLAGFLSWFSLAGLPGTPGALLWLEVGFRLLRAGLVGLFAVLVIAWIVAVSSCFGQAREAFGLAPARDLGEAHGPARARIILWAMAFGILGLFSVVGR